MYFGIIPSKSLSIEEEDGETLEGIGHDLDEPNSHSNHEREKYFEPPFEHT
jgi:hypothetical protein